MTYVFGRLAQAIIALTSANAEDRVVWSLAIAQRVDNLFVLRCCCLIRRRKHLRIGQIVRHAANPDDAILQVQVRIV